jgi:O-antigen/teichoic acid export membrane protein
MGVSDRPLCPLHSPPSSDPPGGNGADDGIAQQSSAGLQTDRPRSAPAGGEPAVVSTLDEPDQNLSDPRAAARPFRCSAAADGVDLGTRTATADLPPETDQGSEVPSTSFWRSGPVTRVLGLVDQGVVSAVGMFTTVVVGQAAGKEALGLYSLGFTLIGIAIAILYSLTSLPYIVFSSRLRGRSLAEYSGSVIVQQGVLSAIVVLALGLTALLWPLLTLLVGNDLAALQWVLWVLAGTAPFVLLREFSRRVILAQWRVLELVQVDLVVSFLQVAALLGLAVAGFLSAGTAHAAVGLACAVGAVIWLLPAWKDFAFRREQMRSDWQRNWSLGAWEAGSQVVGLSQVYLLLWVLAVWVDASATGVFAACVAVVMLSNPFLVGIGNLLTVQAARAWAHEGRAALGRVVGRTTSVIALGMIVFTAALALFGAQLLVLLFGSSYAGQQQVIVLVAIARLFTAVGMMIDQGLLAMERSRLTFTFSCVGLAMTLAAGVGLLMTGAGLVGAATGLVVGSVVATTLRTGVFARLVLAREPRAERNRETATENGLAGSAQWSAEDRTG